MATIYLIYDDIITAHQANRFIAIRSGLGPVSIWIGEELINPETGQAAIKVIDREQHRLIQAELDVAVDEADMDDIWFAGQEARF